MAQVIKKLKFCAPHLTAMSLGRETYCIFASVKSSSFKTTGSLTCTAHACVIHSMQNSGR